VSVEAQHGDGDRDDDGVHEQARHTQHLKAPEEREEREEG